MVVPELRAWRAARPRLARLARGARSRLAGAARSVRPSSAGSARPRLARGAKLATWQFTAIAGTAGAVLAAGVVTAAGPWDSTGQRTAERDRAVAGAEAGGTDHGTRSKRQADGAALPVPSAATVLAGLGGTGTVAGSTGTAPTGRALTGLLGPLLGDAALGTAHTAAVVDVTSGRALYTKDAGRALTPASTTKIATAVAALSALGTDHRFTTRAALEPDTKELVLVGGGDPTLTAHADADGWASLRTLADSTAAALKKRGIKKVTLSYDTTLYAGTALHPIGVNDNLAPVSALMADEGRTDDSTSGPTARVSDPAVSAARTFAGFLKKHGVTTTSPGPSKATGRADTLASVSSPPLSDVVERMLTNSDNDIAEALARQTAVAAGTRADFAGGAAAVGARLKLLGLPVAGARFHDGSGLDRDDRLTANLLTALLVKAGAADHPELRPVLTGLPVAGFTGTLSARYAGDGAAGVVRAKTGTLTGVNALAGTVVDKDGRMLAFAFLTSGTTDPTAAISALDRTATALAACGCH